MERVAQGGTYSDTFGPLLDSSGAPITNGVSAGHLTVEQFVDSADVDRSSGATLSHVGLGKYRITKTMAADAALGSWSFTVKWNNTVDRIRRYPGSFTVLTAAQADPAAALADTVTAVDAISERLTDARAAKLDRIGSNAEVVAAGTLEDGDKLELRRGDSYLAADGNAKQWTYGGSTIASATLTLRTFAGTQALQVPVTQAGSILSADITSDETTALLKGTPIYRYEIVATLAAGGTSTLISGVVWTKD